MNSILTGQEIVRLNGDALARKKGLHCDIQEELGSRWLGDERAPGKEIIYLFIAFLFRNVFEDVEDY